MSDLAEMRKMVGRLLTPAPPGLLDMRWVYEMPRAKGEGEALTNCREMLRKTPGRFMEQMISLEKVWQQTERAAREQATEMMKAQAQTMRSPSEEVGPDAGVELVLEVGERILIEAACS